MDRTIADPLLKILKEAIRHVPQLRFAYGAVGIAAVGGLLTLILGQGKAAIVIWALAFGATVLITVFAQTVARPDGHRPFAGRLLINCVIVVFCGFLIMTVTAFMNLGPSTWGEFLGINDQKLQAFENPGNGPVNFGCEAGNAATAQVVAPAGMHILNVTVEPLDVHAAKTVTPRLVSNDGKTAVGQVDYFGKDREWTRNCPGGGHGGIVMRGQFERDATPLLGLVSALLALASIVALITFLGSPPPAKSRSKGDWRLKQVRFVRKGVFWRQQP